MFPICIFRRTVYSPILYKLADVFYSITALKYHQHGEKISVFMRGANVLDEIKGYRNKIIEYIKIMPKHAYS